jgi:biotin operon repressor/predicted nucleotidyltransferase
MEIKPKILLHLFKDFSSVHTITSIAKELKLSRVGIWKIIKKLNVEQYLLSKSVGLGKTSTSIIKLNWNNSLLEKALNLYLCEEALKQRRWQVNFADLQKEVHFLILFGSIIRSVDNANDIDIMYVTSKSKFVNVQKILDIVQKNQIKKIHAIGLTEQEFNLELQKYNLAYVNAVKNGIVLFGQEKFIKFIKNINNDG